MRRLQQGSLHSTGRQECRNAANPVKEDSRFLTHQPIANCIYSPQRGSQQYLPRDDHEADTTRRKRYRACMSFRWYCPDQVLTVISQNEACTMEKPKHKASNTRHACCTKIHLPETSPSGCQTPRLFCFFIQLPGGRHDPPGRELPQSCLISPKPRRWRAQASPHGRFGWFRYPNRRS